MCVDGSLNATDGEVAGSNGEVGFLGSVGLCVDVVLDEDFTCIAGLDNGVEVSLAEFILQVVAGSSFGL
jgi:hypothetical protein